MGRCIAERICRPTDSISKPTFPSKDCWPTSLATGTGCVSSPLPTNGAVFVLHAHSVPKLININSHPFPFSKINKYVESIIV